MHVYAYCMSLLISAKCRFILDWTNNAESLEAFPITVIMAKLKLFYKHSNEQQLTSKKIGFIFRVVCFLNGF